SGPQRSLHSVPTRRSSDLAQLGLRARSVERRRIEPHALDRVAQDRLGQDLGRGVVPVHQRSVVELEELAASVALLAVLLQEVPRSEEHTSELQSRENLVCR